MVAVPIYCPYLLQDKKVEDGLFGIEKLNVPRSDIPAITHVDYSARIQTVHKETNPRYHALISSFKTRTGCPVVVNTSFNVRGKPIVHNPEDAFRCFMGYEPTWGQPPLRTCTPPHALRPPRPFTRPQFPTA